jgi:hypothetical protein
METSSLPLFALYPHEYGDENFPACKRVGNLMIHIRWRQVKNLRQLRAGGDMAQNAPQTYNNHTRWHPPFHFFLGPGSMLLLILTIVNVVKHYERLDAWILLLIGILFLVAVLLIRINPLRVQDRLIRMEERQRLQALASAEMAARIGELTEAQLVALRFASDEELPTLAAKALASNMQARDIKKAIVAWRADTFRV